MFVPIAVINAVIWEAGFVLAFLVTAIVGAIGTFLFQGMVVEAARDILDGRRDHTIGNLIRTAAPYIARLAGAGILASIAIGIGLLLLIAPGLFLMTIWAVIVPVIVFERAGVFDSFGRSQQLVKGSGWPVLGVVVCLFIIQFVFSILLSAIFVAFADNVVGRAIADLISRTLTAPLSALAAAVIYFELKRIRGEPVPGQEAATIPQAGAPQAATPAAATAPDQPHPQQEPQAPQPQQQTPQQQ